MPSSFTTSLRLTLPVTGENPGSWGTLVNTGITNLVDSSIAGYAAVTMTDADYTLTTVNGLPDEARSMMLNISGTLTAARNVICPTASKLYFIKNATTGGFAITLKTSAGTGISVPNGKSTVLICNGTNVVEAVDFTTTVNTTNLAYTGTLTGGTGIVNLGSNQFYKDASGNVGIGTASPGTILDVARSQASGTTLRVSNSSIANGASAQSWVQADATDLRMVAWSAATPTLGGTSWLFTGTNTALVLGTNSTERVRIDSSGNLLVGTTTSLAKATIAGALSIIDSAAVGYQTQITSTANLSVINAYHTSGQALAFNTTPSAGSSTERMRIDSSGNVGIGVTPTVKLDIFNSANNYVYVRSSSTSAAGIEFAGNGNTAGTTSLGLLQDSSGNAYILQRANLFMVLGTNNTERMRINSSGNVGIATTSPGSALDVKGTLRLSGATSGYVGLAPAAVAGSTTYTLPSADGTASQVLQTNGSATLSWASVGTGTVTGVTATAPVLSSGGTAPIISMTAASSGVNGYMTGTYATKLDGITAGAAPGAANFGYLNIPQNSQIVNYTLALTDAGKHIFHPSTDTTARTFTIPANGSVAFPIGTAVTFVNQHGAGTITIAIGGTDAMYLAGAGTVGNRNLAANGTATALKVTSTEWLISGVNLT